MVFFARQVHVNYMGLSLSATDSWVRRAPPYHTDNLLALVSSEISATAAPASIQHHRVASGFSDTGKPGRPLVPGFQAHPYLTSGKVYEDQDPAGSAIMFGK